MTRRYLHVAVFALVLLVSARQSLGLVDPESSALPPQDWMAQIYTQRNGVLTEFCKGALIHAQWVLSSGFCIFDPFDAGRSSGSGMTGFVVRFAGSQELHTVTRFVQSDDLGVGMMKLAAPVAIQPALLSGMSAAELRGSNVFILGHHSTVAVGDSYFNPNFGQRMRCRVNGQVFFSEGALCYVMARSLLHPNLLQTRGVVVDPADPSVPKNPVDSTMPFSTDGSRLYLDFSADRSYPCHEDIGAPVLRATGSGEHEIVGIVSGVGMTIGMPMCSASLANRFATLSWQRAFIDKTLAQDAFDQLCPARPRLNVDYLGDQGVRVWWEPVEGATGYRLMYTAQAGYQPFTTLDVGNRTQVSTRLSPEPTYSVALVAYSATCTSPISDELAVAL